MSKQLLHDVMDLDMSVDRITEAQDATALHLVSTAKLAKVVRLLMRHGVSAQRIMVNTTTRNLVIRNCKIADVDVLKWLVDLKTIIGPKNTVVVRPTVVLCASEKRAVQAEVKKVSSQTAVVVPEVKKVPAENVCVCMKGMQKAKAKVNKRIFDDEQYTY